MRVVDALYKYAPSNVQVVDNQSESDFEIIHAYGRHDAIERQTNKLQKKGKPYAMIQYAVRSTIRPKATDWQYMWSRAKVVWSYYDLFQLLKEDLGDYPSLVKMMEYPPFEFYYAPLGVDPEVFQETSVIKRFIIGATSQHALAEGVRECAFASKRVDREMFFLGHELRRGPDIVCRQNISDEEVGEYWSQCKYISGLRRVEGFELPVIEGALCGARPIVFDRPHYRKWFGDFAIFIPEGPREEVIDNLEEIFNHGSFWVSYDEKAIIRERFNWETIITNFYKKIL